MYIEELLLDFVKSCPFDGVEAEVWKKLTCVNVEDVDEVADDGGDTWKD